MYNSIHEKWGIAILCSQITQNATSLELAKSYENLIIDDWSINWLVLYDVTTFIHSREIMNSFI